MSSVREIFKEFDFEVAKDEEGNLSDIVFTGEKAGNEDELFETIAPFVEAGSSISFYGEDNSMVGKEILRIKESKCHIGFLQRFSGKP